MVVEAHVTKFAGLKVQTYVPAAEGKKTKLSTRAAHRLALNYDDKHSFTELFARFLEEPGSAGVNVLVVGPWNYGDMVESGNAEVVLALVAARDKLPALRALFIGDITFEECEISWINQGDVSPILASYWDLEEFRVRGGNRLTFGRLKHEHLRVLTIESGGLPATVIEEVAKAKMPALEHLELWLGSENYGAFSDVATLKPLFKGGHFPCLKYLGLCNSDKADAVAAAVAGSAIVQEIETLDLSLGNLTDEGAAALLASPAIAKLKKLDLHHHFLSDDTVKKLKELGPKVDASDRQEPNVWNYQGKQEVHRYNAHSE
jgi:hypothetical protein